LDQNKTPQLIIAEVEQYTKTKLYVRWWKNGPIIVHSNCKWRFEYM